MSGRDDRFSTTHWSLVFAAARADDAGGRDALATLCSQYWYPLYVFVRRRGCSPEDAQDLTQAFFTRLLEKHDIADASPERGRFRSFLLTALKHFLLNQYDRSRALKRGGGAPVVPMDLLTAEGRYRTEPASTESPEDEFNREWGLTVLDGAMRQLRSEYERTGRSAQFARLAELMTPGTADDSYGAAAADLSMTGGAVRVAVHRMRRRFRDILRAEIGLTVDAADIEEEIQFLIGAVGRPVQPRNT